MNFWEAVRTGWIEIRSHKTRSFLSFLAISIGVASILYTFGQIKSTDRSVSDGLELMGPGRIKIEKKRNFVSQGLSGGLSSNDAEIIRESFPELFMVSPIAYGYGTHFRYQEFSNNDILATGITAEWSKRDWVYQQRGRFINSQDLKEAARVCVLVEPGGWHVKPFWARFFPVTALETLLKHRDLLGKDVVIGDHLFTVIGIIKEPPRDQDPRWMMDGRGGSGTVLLPMTTFQKMIGMRGNERNLMSIDDIDVDTGLEETVAIYKKKIEMLLKTLHRGEEDYEVRDNREIIQGILNRVRENAIAILAIGIVAILAGGIGIMNVTLATIFSRIKEIGIRRAVGATRGDVLLQFLVEAMILGLLGGIAGLGLGMLGIQYLARTPERVFEALTLAHYAATLLIAVGTGFIFAIFPASHASRLDPVEALHSE